MNFSKLPKEKKQHLVLIGIITIAVLVGLGLGVIKRQFAHMRLLEGKKVATQKKLELVEQTIKKTKQIEADLTENRKALVDLEDDIAEGDLYSWVINMLRKFSSNYKVEIPQKSGITGPTEMTMLPNFPYKQASLTILGTAHYHELGRFISDFENEFPHIRLLNLDVQTTPMTTTGDGEVLSFKLEIVTLVKPGAS